MTHCPVFNMGIFCVLYVTPEMNARLKKRKLQITNIDITNLEQDSIYIFKGQPSLVHINITLSLSQIGHCNIWILAHPL